MARRRCRFTSDRGALALRVSVEGPPAGLRLAAWPGLLDAVSVSCRPLVLHTCVCPSAGHREVQTPSKASVLPHLPKGTAWWTGGRARVILLLQRQCGPEERVERPLGYFTLWFCDFVNKSLGPFWLLIYEMGTIGEATSWD